MEKWYLVFDVKETKTYPHLLVVVKKKVSGSIPVLGFHFLIEKHRYNNAIFSLWRPNVTDKSFYSPKPKILLNINYGESQYSYNRYFCRTWFWWSWIYSTFLVNYIELIIILKEYLIKCQINDTIWSIRRRFSKFHELKHAVCLI